MSSDARPDLAASARAAALLTFADGLLVGSKGHDGERAGEIRQYVSFGLQDQEFAIPILDCREILRATTITRIPEAPPQVRGVVNLRGRIVPAVDVRTCLGMEPSALTGRSRLIVVETAGRFFALLVDRVARIVKLASEQIGLPDGALRWSCVTGTARLGESAIHVIDSERLLLASPGVSESQKE